MQMTDALQHTTSLSYDRLGRRVLTTYDQLGRRSSRTLPAGGASETYLYDPAGNLKSKTDFNGHTTTYPQLINGVQQLEKASGIIIEITEAAGLDKEP